LLGLEREIERKLRLLAIREIGQVAALSREALVAQFGKTGRALWLLTRGLDGRPVMPRRMPPIEHGVRQFEHPLTTRDALDAAIHLLADELAERLEARGAALHEVYVTVRVARGNTYTERLHLLQPVAGAKGIAATIGQLIERMRLTASGREEGIASIEICLTHLVSSAPRQLALFTHKPARQELIDLAAILAERYGDCFYEAVIQEQGAILPERRFRFLRVNAS
jgi:DNA polymerase-4